MPDVDGFAAGTPSWVDLASPDLDASAAFYGELLGWDCTEAAEDDSAGGYRMFTLRGRSVAGLGPVQGEAPPNWTTYVTVDDADAAAAKIAEAGGTAFLEPMDVLDAGRMAVFADSGGAVFAIWQPMQHRGAQIVNEPGALTWNELATRDLAASKEFYGAVFGWEGDTMPAGESNPEYTMLRLAGTENAIAGMITMSDAIYPPGVPAHWLTYLQVADCAAATAKAKQLGASVDGRGHGDRDRPHLGHERPAGRIDRAVRVQGRLMAQLTHTALGAWSGGRFLHFGEPVDEQRLVALLRPGRRHRHRRHRRRLRRGRRRRGRGPRAQRAAARLLPARRRDRPRLLRGRAPGREGLPALHRPAAARPGLLRVVHPHGDRAQPRALRRRPLRPAAAAQPRPRGLHQRRRVGRAARGARRRARPTCSASRRGPPTASRSTSSTAWSASAPTSTGRW